uniref:MMS1_N domain-containing protein n=1 Tax=Macrostomum lignano TaxID=282301 RepID=A0A1I8I1E1_9PLAT
APPLEVSQLGQTDRFVDLKVLGVFRQNSDGTFSPDEPLQADDLKLKIYYENKLLTVLHPRHSDYFSIPLKYPQSSNKMLIFSAILSSRTGAPVQLASCTAALTIGTVKCRLLNGKYIIFKIRGKTQRY